MRGDRHATVPVPRLNELGRDIPVGDDARAGEQVVGALASHGAQSVDQDAFGGLDDRGDLRLAEVGEVAAHGGPLVAEAAKMGELVLMHARSSHWRTGACGRR